MEAIVSQRVVALLEARLRSRDRLKAERMQRFIPLVRSLGEAEAGGDDELALMAMLVDDFYQDTFHAPLAELGPQAPSARPAPDQGGGRKPGRRPSRPRRSGDRRRG
ncbi:MAG TPA: hypothetical protein VF498_17055 [Anaerolineales bacterium]